MLKEDFYKRVSEILDTNIEYKTPYSGAKRPNRWNNRSPGNGRFEGYGIVRMFSLTFISVDLYFPRHAKGNFKTPDTALDFINMIILEDSIDKDC